MHSKREQREKSENRRKTCWFSNESKGFDEQEQQWKLVIQQISLQRRMKKEAKYAEDIQQIKKNSSKKGEGERQQ